MNTGFLLGTRRGDATARLHDMHCRLHLHIEQLLLQSAEVSLHTGATYAFITADDALRTHAIRALCHAITISTRQAASGKNLARLQFMLRIRIGMQ